MKKKITIIATAAVAAIAIVFVIAQRQNNGLPDPDTMAQILADTYIVDAVLQSKGELYNKQNQNAERSYHTVLEHYGISKELFDTTLAWYAAHPEEHALIYEKVTNLLVKKEAQFKNLLLKKDSITRRIKTLNDSLCVNFWNYNKTIRLPRPKNDTLPKDLVFNFKTDSLRGGKLTLSLDYVFPRSNKNDDTCNIQLIVAYNDTIADTVAVGLGKRHVMEPVEIVYDVRDSMDMEKIQASLLKTKNFKETNITFSDIKLFYMPYEITDSIQFDEIILPPLLPY